MPTVVVGVRRDGAPRIPTRSRRAPGRAYLLVVRALGFFLSLKSRGADFKDKANHVLPSFKENGRFRTITWAFKNHRLACFNHIQPSLLLTGLSHGFRQTMLSWSRTMSIWADVSEARSPTWLRVVGSCKKKAWGCWFALKTKQITQVWPHFCHNASPCAARAGRFTSPNDCWYLRGRGLSIRSSIINPRLFFKKNRTGLLIRPKYSTMHFLYVPERATALVVLAL
jgi:hypothetical protein